MPPQLPTQEADDALFDDDPWVEPPIQMDYGTNVKVASNVYMNVNCVFLDTCTTSIGSRTLIGPNVSFFSGTHPLDPELRNGTAGPETGKEIHVEEDCWIGGNAIILPGVRIGRGASIGAGSVVTKVSPLPGKMVWCTWNFLTRGASRMSLPSRVLRETLPGCFVRSRQIWILLSTSTGV